MRKIILVLALTLAACAERNHRVYPTVNELYEATERDMARPECSLYSESVNPTPRCNPSMLRSVALFGTRFGRKAR